MSIPSSYYWVIISLLLIATVALFYFLGVKRNNKKLKGTGGIIAVAFLVIHKWVFPNVYTVEHCGIVHREILLFPQTAQGLSMNYGKHCYIFNNSTTSLKIETVLYGNHNEINSPDKILNATITPGQAKKLKTVAIDYFFETEKESVTTKSDGAIMYKVSCNQNQ